MFGIFFVCFFGCLLFWDLRMLCSCLLFVCVCVCVCVFYCGCFLLLLLLFWGGEVKSKFNTSAVC